MAKNITETRTMTMPPKINTHKMMETHKMLTIAMMTQTMVIKTLRTFLTYNSRMQWARAKARVEEQQQACRQLTRRCTTIMSKKSSMTLEKTTKRILQSI